MFVSFNKKSKNKRNENWQKLTAILTSVREIPARWQPQTKPNLNFVLLAVLRKP